MWPPSQFHAILSITSPSSIMINQSGTNKVQKGLVTATLQFPCKAKTHSGKSGFYMDLVCVSERAWPGAVCGGGKWREGGGRPAQPRSADSAPGSRQGGLPKIKLSMRNDMVTSSR
uniref:Uncharacterized protein n=1 Tax=Timema monikensis TaxID=170555 RepID=A0A7R9EAF5_9NEOP|nr:unnamed protein product [Timema monikensis]